MPYSKHFEIRSSDVIGALVDDINVITHHVILPTLIVITSLIIILIILFFIYIALSQGFIILITFIFLVFFLVFLIKKITNSLYSHNASKQQKALIQLINESLKSIREIITNQHFRFFGKLFYNQAAHLKNLESKNIILNGIPRIAIETFSVLTIIVIIYLSLTKFSTASIQLFIPNLALAIFAVQKLMPYMQQLFSNWVLISNQAEAFSAVFKFIDLPVSDSFFLKAHNVNFKKIDFRNVSYKYPSSASNVLLNINFAINKGMKIGIIGESGSGKSTLLDLIMGLIQPTEGTIKVNGKELTGISLVSWQRAFANVPQNIFLLDSSIAENIAFGVPLEKINLKLLSDSAEYAELINDIRGFPDGFKSLVGENGIKLSGGQKQRIAIARAFYKNADIIIFDEATSALDSKMEDKIIDKLHKKNKNLTLIHVTHRLSALKSCEYIFKLSHKKLICVKKPVVGLK